MSYEAVFLDLDNTLYPYEPCNAAGKRAAYESAQSLGYDLTRDAFEQRYQDGRRQTKRELAGTASAHERFLYFKRLIELHTGDHDAAEALQLGEAYWNQYVRTMELFEGVEETLTTFQDEGLEVVIVTNLTTRIQLEKLANLGIDECIDLLVTSEETGREKPSAIMFTTPLAQLDRRPSEVVMVGDSLGSDIEGGNAVGMDTVLFNAEPDPDAAAYRQPDHTIEEFTDLQEVIL